MKQSTQTEKTFPSILQSTEGQRRDDLRGEREVYRIEDARDDNSNPPEYIE